jgi:phosphoenolpyruvate carboxykinase (GTP)
VNWFRQDAAGKFMWPGFGENLRVLHWILDRCQGKADAVETPIGYVPTDTSIDTHELDIDPAVLHTLLNIDNAKWKKEMADLGQYFDSFGKRVPEGLKAEHARVSKALEG